MVEIGFCLFAAAIAFIAGRRSLVAGLIATILVGYVYGIVRANFTSAASHFVFDAGVLGLYVSRLNDLKQQAEGRNAKWLRLWVIVLVLWPLILSLLPLQDPLIQLVGLRANIFLLPFFLLGARLKDDEITSLALGLALLNLAATGMAFAEYFLGIERFFPRSEVTQILYNSKDVANFTAYRIPSFFSSPAAYGGTMVMTLPFLLGAWARRKERLLPRLILALGFAAALAGVLLSASRSHFIVMALLVSFSIFRGKIPMAVRSGFLVVVGLVMILSAGNERLLRFTELSDTQYVTTRVATSVNMNFLEVALRFPMGNGLGGGGTSIPYFLQDRIKDPVGLENEYARIMLEEGIPGLLLWLGFLAWVFTRKIKREQPFKYGKRLARFCAFLYFLTGATGIGLLTSIPGTSILLLLVGWSTADLESTKKDDSIDATNGTSDVNLHPSVPAGLLST